MREVFFTQDSISSKFSDGRVFTALIDGLRQGIIDTLRDSFLTLDAVQVSGRLYSLANRRLYCLKEYQKTVNSVVRVRLRVTCNKDPMIERFLRSFTTNDYGLSVRRRAPPRVPVVMPLVLP